VEHCCGAKSEELDALWSKQARTLWLVLAINAGMFVVEAVAGFLAGSAAVLADSLDMLGDALVYGVSLLVVGRSLQSRSWAALLKGSVMLLFGLGVLVEVVYKLISHEVPNSPLMAGTGAVALLANSICLVLLTRHRSDDINMRSAWVCSRNDIAANIGVLLAAAGVYLTHTIWPDIAVGVLITGLFLWSAIGIVREAIAELRATGTAAKLQREQPLNASS
jgi:cation diffusion facilitator family transporter